GSQGRADSALRSGSARVSDEERVGSRMSSIDEIERRLEEQETLLEIGLALAETLQPQQVLETALARAEEFCAAETSSIWELDEAPEELFFRLVRGVAAPEIGKIRVPLGHGIVGSVALS